jgi:autotransporter-associated beta strand protein
MQIATSLHSISRFNRLSILTAAGGLLACGIPALGASVVYTGVVLYPISPVPIAASTAANAAVNVGGYPQTIAEGKTVGAVSNKAVLWTGAAVAPIALNPAGALSSDAVGTDGSNQVGWATGPLTPGAAASGQHAEVWSGSANSAMALNPVGYTSSAAYGVNGLQVVGSGTKAAISGSSTTTSQSVALLWPSLASASPATTAVNLNPTGYDSSAALGTDSTNQVGYGIPTAVGLQAVSPHALLWSGTASSAVDLNPAGFSGSYANGVGSSPVLDPPTAGGAAPIGGVTQEVGYGFTNGKTHALLWTGTADSVVDLNPGGGSVGVSTISSEANGTNGREQVGWVSNGNAENAAMWSGTAASMVNLNAFLPSRGTWTNSTAYTVDLSGHVYGTATGKINGLTATYAVEWLPFAITPVTYVGATANTTWDVGTTADFSDGSSTTTYQDGDPVSFGASPAPSSTITLVSSDSANVPGALTPSSVTVSSPTAYTFTGAGIAGATGLTKSDTGTLTISNANTYTGPTNINQGMLVLTSTGSIANSVVTVGDGTNPATLTLSPGTSQTTQTLAGLNVTPTGSVQIQSTTNSNRTLLVIGSGGFTNTGSIDVTNNAMVIQGGDLAAITAMVAQAYQNGTWTGTGITSSTAAGDSTHLTAVGVIQNSTDGITPLYGGTLGTFEGSTPGPTDVLVKYTYYGDANLDGTVSSADYALIDNGYLQHLTGWYNGDFNYDGIINGSDYTLIDNAYNTQGAAIASAISTARIGGTASVPEPGSICVLMLGCAGVLSRRVRYFDG